MLFLLPTALAMSPEAAEVTPPPPRPPPVEEEAAEAAASSCRVELCRVFRTPTGESLEDTAPAERWKNFKKNHHFCTYCFNNYVGNLYTWLCCFAVVLSALVLSMSMVQ